MALRSVRLPALLEVRGLVHGFEQRSARARAETRGDTRTRVLEALRPHGRLHLLRQVHGAGVAAAPFSGRPEADAATASAPGLLLGIETADCLPILLVDPELRLVAAAHAGWRGTARGVARAAVLALLDLGSRPEALIAALGPGIGPCCYEVGDELRGAFGPLADSVFRPGPRGRPHLDVREANVRQLREAGLRPERLHHVRDCTCCTPELYHSYRRDGPDAGRMISYVGFAG
ncbi:MAG TPA: peptidoglycan editing factor PgeF [Vicinamibacteria bacterium]|nr:peptidoglycan editing factor PgeF [Vicinamibacteria bacterium]